MPTSLSNSHYKQVATKRFIKKHSCNMFRDCKRVIPPSPEYEVLWAGRQILRGKEASFLSHGMALRKDQLSIRQLMSNKPTAGFLQTPEFTWPEENAGLWSTAQELLRFLPQVPRLSSSVVESTEVLRRTRQMLVLPVSIG